MIGKLSEAFLLGLSMGPACLSYCAPVFLPVIAVRKQTGWGSATRIVGLFLLGRLAGYTAMGVAAGLLGSLLARGAGMSVWGLIQILTGGLIILYGIAAGGTAPQLCGLRARTGALSVLPAVTGLLTGLSLCPPFGAAVAGAAATLSVKNSILYFWAFFAGTAAYFFPFGLLSPLTRREGFRQVARVCLFLAGVWLICEGGIAVLSAR